MLQQDTSWIICLSLLRLVIVSDREEDIQEGLLGEDTNPGLEQ